MIEVSDVGQVLITDQDGYIVSQSSVDKIKPPWLEAVEDCKQAYLEHYGDKVKSIYVRGSVTRGQAVEGISDVDTLALIFGNDDDCDTSWIGGFNAEFKQKFPFATEAEIQIVSYEGVMDATNRSYRWDRLVIKTQAACIYGEDIAARLAGFKPGREMAGHASHLRTEIEHLLTQLDQLTPERVRTKCIWMMKRMLRSGFEIVMAREGTYTRDLYPCYEAFAKYYPEQADQMYRALELALNPTSNRDELRQFLLSFGTWLGREAKIYATK